MTGPSKRLSFSYGICRNSRVTSFLWSSNPCDWLWFVRDISIAQSKHVSIMVKEFPDQDVHGSEFCAAFCRAIWQNCRTSGLQASPLNHIFQQGNYCHCPLQHTFLHGPLNFSINSFTTNLDWTVHKGVVKNKLCCQMASRWRCALQIGCARLFERTLGGTRNKIKYVVQPKQKKKTIRANERAVNGGVLKLQRWQLRGLKAHSHTRLHVNTLLW